MNNKLALVIEDDFDGSMVFAKAMEANGLEPEQIMTGNRALERIAETIPTLVVLDLHLPVVQGTDILMKIRADNRLVDTLVVVVTADPRMADMIRDEADLVLLKPTTFSQVRDLVGRLLALRERNAKPSTPGPEPVPAAALAEAPGGVPAASQPVLEAASQKSSEVPSDGSKAVSATASEEVPAAPPSAVPAPQSDGPEAAVEVSVDASTEIPVAAAKSTHRRAVV